MSRWVENRAFSCAGHAIVIPGAPFPKFNNVLHAWTVAKREGCDVTIQAFAARVKKQGADWKTVTRPVRSEKQQQSVARRKQRQRDEIHEICQTLDARKAQLSRKE